MTDVPCPRCGSTHTVKDIEQAWNCLDCSYRFLPPNLFDRTTDVRLTCPHRLT